MAGSLVVLARQSPLNGGVTVPGAQLFTYNAGTTTKRNTYTTSALSVLHSNPQVADANGRFTAAWLDPDDGAYKNVLASATDTDPPASPFWTEDNIPIQGASISEGSFTATFTGMTGATTGTVNYIIKANSGGTGKECTLFATANIQGTSLTTAMTMTGLPAACTPANAVRVLCDILENSTSQLALATIAAAGTTITFGTDLPFSATGFTAANNKGVTAGWTISYPL